MKRVKILLLIIVFWITIIGLTNISNSAEKFIICNDDNLYNALCSSIGDDKILDKDFDKKIIKVDTTTVDAMTELDLTGKGIRDIKGLEVFTNLLTLDLSNNEISDISQLKNLNNIEILKLSNNKITDISPLGVVESSGGEEENPEKKLTTLYLNNNIISNISPLSTLTKLTTLNLSGNQISDLASCSFSGFEELKTLNLSNNRIENCQSLSDSSVEVLSLQNNSIDKFDDIKLDSIKSLNLQNNKITNIDFVEKLDSLIGLDLSYNRITTIPEFFANWIINNKISNLKMNNQTIQMLSQDKSISFSKNSSYTNLLYWGLYFNKNMQTEIVNGKFDSNKILFEFDDIKKLSSIKIKDGIFVDSSINLTYGGIIAEDDVANATEKDDSNKENNDVQNDKKEPTQTGDKTTDDKKVEEPKTDNAKPQNPATNDPTTAEGKMPYTGITTRVFVISILIFGIILICASAFYQNKKKLSK